MYNIHFLYLLLEPEAYPRGLEGTRQVTLTQDNLEMPMTHVLALGRKPATQNM